MTWQMARSPIWECRVFGGFFSLGARQIAGTMPPNQFSSQCGPYYIVAGVPMTGRLSPITAALTCFTFTAFMHPAVAGDDEKKLLLKWEAHRKEVATANIRVRAFRSGSI